MGRAKKADDEISPATLRWRKYIAKKKSDNPQYTTEIKKKMREHARSQRAKETIEEGDSRKKIIRMAVKSKREAKKIANSSESSLNLSNSENVYHNKYTLGKALKKVEKALPSNHQRRVIVLRELLKKIGVNKNDVFPLDENLSDTEILAKKFYFNPCVSYTAPGMADTMIIKTCTGKERVRKYYLTCFIREAYALFVQAHGVIVSSKRFHSLRPEHVLLLKDTPSEVCKCLYHENMFYMLASLNINYDESIWDDLLCDSNLASKCWSNLCPQCSNFCNLSPDKHPEEVVKLHLWKNDEKFMRLTTELKKCGEVQEMLNEMAEKLYSHVLVKRVQSAAFEKDKKSYNRRVIQVDFAMNFSAEVQNEIQSALWSRVERQLSFSPLQRNLMILTKQC